MAFRQPNEQAKQSVQPFVEPAKGRDFEKEAFGKCLHAFLVEAYKMNKRTDGMTLPDENTLNECIAWAKASMTGKLVLPKWPVQKPTPSLDDEPPIRGEDIPF